MITDTRFGVDCGNVTQAVLELDTSEIFAQYTKYFNDWFNELQDELNSNQAGHLQNELNNIRTALGINLDTYSSTATYSKWDLVVYNHTIYECSEDNVTGDWDVSKWTIVPIIVNDEE